MALGVAGEGSITTVEASSRNYTVPLMLMVSLYFGIGFITALNDILVPHFKDLFHLTNVTALLVQFCFFGAYFVMSLPSGWIVGRIGYKSGIVVALSVMGLGLLLFLPASVIIFYPLFLFALFVVGSGLALLQVAINPYVGALGPPETAASRLNLAGFFNSIATTSAPRVGAAFIFIAAGASTAQLAHSVRKPYLILAICAFAMAVITAFVQLPDVIERGGSKSGTDGSAWSFSHLRLGALAIFFYVGAEVAIGSIMITYLGQPSMGGLSHEVAARYVSYYWGLSLIGRFVGYFAMQRIRAQRALAVVSLIAAVLITLTVAAHGHIAMWAVVFCGLCNSVMWPCIFPLAVKGMGRFTSQGSGILITMVVGGAVIPEIQGFLADTLGYQHSFAIVLLCYAYIFFFAIRGHRNLNSADALSSQSAALIQ
ncbi:sugar MFS transporter [Tunturibacter empetritectus]|uniref:FHS family L-fucose permease-like MFS transporter n=1 Tax=Tunturiibacter lichenicola TaxID=2051959 RepID=A0A7W8J4I2_9BACT|nr:sugar MFS transporter [Edaphobacter lichenicola]MBB5342355.1 FHS family L-fucose permease-like MFS transporter [Edaphobacter lichenicola]